MGLLGHAYRAGLVPAAIPSDAPPYDPARYAHALRHVNGRGWVDYAALAKDRGELDLFVASLAGSSPVNHPERFPDSSHELAYWLNAYNALTLQALVDRYPLDAVDGVRGFLLREVASFPLGGERLTLSAIEARLTRMQDARVHFALHTGAKSGPGLLDSPYQPELLDPQLTEAGQRFIGRADALKLQPGRVSLSAVLHWRAEELMGAVPAGHRSPLLQVVWAFLPDACEERPGCDTRSDLDRICGPRLDRCAVDELPFDWRLDDTGSGH